MKPSNIAPSKDERSRDRRPILIWKQTQHECLPQKTPSMAGQCNRYREEENTVVFKINWGIDLVSRYACEDTDIKREKHTVMQTQHGWVIPSHNTFWKVFMLKGIGIPSRNTKRGIQKAAVDVFCNHKVEIWKKLLLETAIIISLWKRCILSFAMQHRWIDSQKLKWAIPTK